MRSRLPQVLLLVSVLLVPSTGASGEVPGFSEVLTLAGEVRQGEVAVSGSARFGGQNPVFVSEDDASDAPGMVRVGDFRGVDQTGLDLLAATLSVPDPDEPELLVEWRVSNLPPQGFPEATRASMAFKVGGAIYQVQAKRSNVTGTTVLDDPQGSATRTSGAFQLLGNCAEVAAGIPLCDHLAWLTGGFDERTGTISARVPLGSAIAPALTNGATLRPTGHASPELAGVFAGLHAGPSATGALNDEAPFGPPVPGYGFEVPDKRVSIGLAPKGTDPSAVVYTTEATVEGDAFAGAIATEGYDPATTDVFVRACFANDCGYRSLGGASKPGTDAVAVLRLGGPSDESFAFWRGGLIGNGLRHSVSQLSIGADCDDVPCFTYALRVDSPGAERLRIGIDVPARADGYTVSIDGPQGRRAALNNIGSYNDEAYITNPPVGDYVIVVRPTSAENNFFSMRAKLEATIPVAQPDANGLVLPDLRPSAPYEFGFAAPVNPLNGPFLAPDDANPPASAGGIGPVSCSPDDTAFEGVVRCLRFSFGLSNVGRGNFHLRFNTSLTNHADSPAFQCIDRPGGTPLARPAGSTSFHATHLHIHYNDVMELDLLRVTDPVNGTLEPAGGGRKIGYSPVDQALGDWYRFDQATRSSRVLAPNCTGQSSSMGLSAGWGDVYRYQRAGNFVNFGTNPDGRYVVRMRVDPKNNILESDETNNVSYAYIEVSLGQVKVLEWGRGLSPWDPDKELTPPRYREGVPW